MDKHKGRNTLSAAEARELGMLYRAVTSDLALARRDYPNQRVTLFLNQLLTRAHSFIYQQDVSDFRQLVRYFTHTIPQTFRQTGLFTLAAFLLFVAPGLAGYQIAFANPDIAEPLGLVEVQETLAEQDIWTDIPVNQRPYASAFIMSNNIRIAILAFGGGVTFGLFSLYILAMNGLHIGAVLGLAAHYGMGWPLFNFIIPHGVIELSVIFIAGGAGLQLGWALLNPGLYSRRDALGIAARHVLPLVVASVLLLIVAGLIEGFVSPSDAPPTARALVAVGSGMLLYGYFGLAGRG
ncbi:MAG: stage II sporulation protein M [Anaerolineae bacterium]|nr:stage II sporulation protein M [Anaerolineae bacterium]